jgi:DNA-binding NarL/FixJ family response regulator
MIRVIIAHQDPSIRLALQLFLQAQSEVEIVSEVKRVGELLRDASFLAPDLVILAWDLPDFGKFSLSSHQNKLTGTPSFTQIRGIVIQSLHDLPSSPVIVVTGQNQEDTFSVRYAGADEYIYHGDEPSRLANILNSIREKQ